MEDKEEMMMMMMMIFESESNNCEGVCNWVEVFKETVD